MDKLQQPASDSSQQKYRKITLQKPLRETTRKEAKIVVLVSAVSIVAKSPQAGSIISLLSSSGLTLRTKIIPFAATIVLSYFMCVFLLHVISDLIIWWPKWRFAKRSDTTLSGTVVTGISVMRLGVECLLPLVFAVLSF